MKRIAATMILAFVFFCGVVAIVLNANFEGGILSGLEIASGGHYTDDPGAPAEVEARANRSAAELESRESSASEVEIPGDEIDDEAGTTQDVLAEASQVVEPIAPDFFSVAGDMEQAIMFIRSGANPIRGFYSRKYRTAGGREELTATPGRDEFHPGAPMTWVRREDGSMMAMYSDHDREVLGAEAEKVAERRGSIIGALEVVDAEDGVNGFAYDTSSPELVMSVELFIDGFRKSIVFADSPRESAGTDSFFEGADLIANRGFEFPADLLEGLSGEHKVRVIAHSPDGSCHQELSGSPRIFGGNRLPVGGLIEVTKDHAIGFAIDPDAPEVTVYIECIVGGVHYEFLKADKSWAELPVTPGSSAIDAQVIAAGYKKPENAIDGRLFFFKFDPALGAQSSVQFIFFDSSSDKLFDEAPGSPFRPMDSGWLAPRKTDDQTDDESEETPDVESPDPDNALPHGEISFVTSTRISGWAVDQDAGDDPIFVDVFYDGEPYGRMLADQEFAVLARHNDISSPFHAFIADIPARYLDGATHTFSAFAVNTPDGTNPELKGSPVEFTSFVNNDPAGYLDDAGYEILRGWAYDPDSGPAPVTVEVWIDDKLYKTITADRDRPDLVPTVCPEPAHEWAIDAPAFIRDGDFHTIRAFAQNFPDGPPKELGHSPWEIGALRPYLGITVSASDGGGLVVTNVADDSTSAAALDNLEGEFYAANPEAAKPDAWIAQIPSGASYVLPEDRITSYQDNEAGDPQAFDSWLQTRTPGEVIELAVVRKIPVKDAEPSELMTPGEMETAEAFLAEPLAEGQSSAEKEFLLSNGYFARARKFAGGDTDLTIASALEMSVHLVIGERIDSRLVRGPMVRGS
ncbi:MAG: hypothetical protein NUW37_03605 [Planctomycetes bacterium]|nr:hypothetical protein [Planctomycetota bacterium]